MRRESLVLGLAVACSVAIMGWIIWAERPGPPPPASASAPVTPPSSGVEVLPVDEVRVAELTSAAETRADDVEARVSLANLYFEARDFEQAVPWYEAVLALTPDDVGASTNLGISYYYMGAPERAVNQFERSLEIEPTHAQTLVSLGIVKAFALQDLDGATAAWQRAVEVAPDTPEARAAIEALNRLQAAHSNTVVAGQTSGSGAP